MDNWVNGDYVITRSWNGVDEYTESLSIYYEGHGQSVLRKATLDDFKVYIPDYGYVLVCQYKNSWVLFFEKEEDGILFVKGNHIQRALVESFIRDRQAVVAPKRLWSHDPRCSTLRKYNG